MTTRNRFVRLARYAGLAVLLPAALIALPDAPAQALSGSIREVSPPTASDSSDLKVAQVTCPAPRVLLGMGASISGGDGNVALTRVQPTSGQSGVVEAAEHTPFAGDWSLTAYAVCSSGSVAAWQIQTASSLWNSTSTRAVTVDCPTGTRVTGTGFQVQYDWDNDVVVESVKPDVNLESVTVSAREATGTANNWWINAFAVCATVNGPAQRVSFETISESSPTKGANRRCPSGMTLTGVGGEVRDGDGAVLLDRLRVDAPLETANARAHEAGAYPDDWSVKVFGICSQ